MEEKNKPRIIPLAPRNDLGKSDKRFSVYRKTLDAAFDNPSLHNIALSGNLGSGKSSILHSYDKQRNGGKEKFLYVSLMDFSAPGFDEPVKPKRLEHSFLCQVHSHCRRNTLPDTTIGGIPERLRFLSTWSAVLTVIFSAIFILLFKDHFFALAKQLGISKELLTTSHHLLYLGLGLLLCICFFCLTHSILARIRFRKLTVKTQLADAEVDLDSELTSLDTHKFELIYAICQLSSKIDYTVVIEDLDRLDSKTCVEIMEKLRELNVLTNNHLRAVTPWYKQWKYHKFWNTTLPDTTKPKDSAISKRLPHHISIIKDRYYSLMERFRQWGQHHLSRKTHIRFVYAIRDDLFDPNQRTKFYDYIIPVVPTICHFNSDKIFSEHLRKHNINPYSSEISDIINVVAPILTDYRQLIAVLNEFEVFWNLYCYDNIGDEPKPDNQDLATLLAVTVYKVLFPAKYSSAYLGSGKSVLTTIDDADLSCYKDETYGKLVQSTINQLFIRKHIHPTALRMVGLTSKGIISNWINTLNFGTPQQKSKLLDSLTHSGFFKSTHTVADAEMLINAIQHYQIFSRETNRYVVCALALLFEEYYNCDYSWMKHNLPNIPCEVLKQHFTNIICVFVHKPFKAVANLFEQNDLTIWMLHNLEEFSTKDFKQYSWSSDMRELLVGLITYEPFVVKLSNPEKIKQQNLIATIYPPNDWFGISHSLLQISSDIYTSRQLSILPAPPPDPRSEYDALPNRLEGLALRMENINPERLCYCIKCPNGTIADELARLFYYRMNDSKAITHIGWIDYRRFLGDTPSIKNSFYSDLRLFDDNPNPDSRFSQQCAYFDNEKSNSLLVVVIKDYPADIDSNLSLLATLKGLSIIIFADREIPGYYAYQIHE